VRGVGRDARRGAQQRLGERQYRVLQGDDAGDDLADRAGDGGGDHLVQVADLRRDRAFDRADPVVLVVEPLVESLHPGGKLAVKGAEAGREPVQGRGDPGQVHLLEGVKPTADLGQRDCRVTLLSEVFLNGAGEQFAHPVRSLMAVVAELTRLRDTQQQFVVARLIHRAPSNLQAGLPEHFSSSECHHVY
jgi:hypothetical protein